MRLFLPQNNITHTMIESVVTGSADNMWTSCGYTHNITYCLPVFMDRCGAAAM